MLYTKKALQMGAIAVGLAAFAGQSSLAESAKKEDSKPVAKTETMQVLPELTMASHFVGVPYNQSGVSVSIINPESFEKRGIETLSGALARTSGVYMLDGGSTGQYGSSGYMSVRGVSLSGGTMLMVDGMRISDVSNASGLGSYGSGPEDLLGVSSLFDIGSAELVKGPQGAVYGGNSYGGVLALNTPEGTDKSYSRFFNEVGSFGSYTGTFTTQGRIKKLGYFVGVGYETTQNDARYEGGLPYNPTGRHSDFSQWQEALRLTYDATKDVKVSMTYRRQDSRYAEPGTVSDAMWNPVAIEDFNTDMRSNIVTASVDAKLNELWTTSFMVGFYDRHVKFDWPDQAAWYDHSKFQSEWRNALTWNKEWKTILGMAWDRTVYHTVNNYTRYDILDSNLAWFAEQMWAPTDYLDFSLAGRLEHSSIWNNNATWRFSGSWKVQGHKDASTRILGSVGSGFRAPTQWEQYADTVYGGYHYLGNPDLSISRSLGGDLGVEQRLADDHYLTVSGFWTRINNIIENYYGSSDWPDPTPALWKNGSYGIMTGVETSFRGEFKDAWKSGYTVNYTYVMPRNNEGKQLQGTARHTINAEIHTSPIEKLTCGVGVLAAMNRTNTFGSNRLDNYMTCRLFARYQVTDNVALHLRLENLFDQRYEITQSPNVWSSTALARGFGIFGGVTVEF